MSTVLLSYADLCERGIRYSKMHLRRLESAGKFPRRVEVSPQRVAWVGTEIDEWISARIAVRDQKGR
jgi:prophage regulatory protein